MNHEQAFLEAIQEADCSGADPWTPRLIYADWLEEQGDFRGELLRQHHAAAQGEKVAAEKWADARRAKAWATAWLNEWLAQIVPLLYWWLELEQAASVVEPHEAAVVYWEPERAMHASVALPGVFASGHEWSHAISWGEQWRGGTRVFYRPTLGFVLRLARYAGFERSRTLRDYAHPHEYGIRAMMQPPLILDPRAISKGFS